MQHEPAPGGLAERGHTAGIAAEARDVVAHPLEGGDRVVQTEVRVVAAERSRIEEAEGADAIVGADDDDILLSRETRTVVDRLRGRAEHERAAVEPHHDGLRFAARVANFGRRPHVEREAVLVDVRDRRARHVVDDVEHLRTGRAEAGRCKRPRPRRHRTRRLEATRRRIRNPAKHTDDAIVDIDRCALDRACARLRDRRHTAGEPTAVMQYHVPNVTPDSRVSFEASVVASRGLASSNDGAPLRLSFRDRFLRSQQCRAR